MRKWGKIVGLLTLMVGCQSSTKAPYADNPLLMSREPLKQSAAVSKSSSGGKPAIPMMDPPDTPASTPPAPSASVAKSPTNSDAPSQPSVSSAKSTANSASAPVAPATLTKSTTNPAAAPAISDIIATSAQIPQAVTTAPRLPEPLDPPPAAALPKPPAPSPPPPAAPTPPISEKPLVRFDHAADYTWLVGEIDVHYRGHKELRFCPNSEENAIGGKVRLVDDPQLANLKAGTLVRIEGEIVQNDPTAVAGEYPRYHMRRIQVIEIPAK